MGEEEKTRLECEKLQLEIDALKQKWWQRPAYLAAVLPTMLAIASLTVAWQSGYFQAAATRLENQKHDLTSDIAMFELRKVRLERNDKALQESAEATKKENQTLVEQTNDLNKKVADREARLGDLDRERQKLSGEIITARQTATTAQEAADFAPLNIYLASLAEKYASPGDDAASAFIKQFRESASRKSAWSSRLQKRLTEEKSLNARTSVLYVLYFGTRDEKWKRELLASIREACLSATNDWLTQLPLRGLNDQAARRLGNDEGWSAKDQLDVMKFVAELLDTNSVSVTVQHEALLYLWYINHDGSRPYDDEPKAFLRVVREARNLAGAPDERDRNTAYNVLAELAPSAFLVKAAEILGGGKSSLADRATIMERLSRLHLTAMHYQPFEIGQPKGDDTAAWQQWQAAHSDLIAAWNEPDLTTFASNHIALVNAMERGTLQ